MNLLVRLLKILLQGTTQNTALTNRHISDDVCAKQAQQNIWQKTNPQ